MNDLILFVRFVCLVAFALFFHVLRSAESTLFRSCWGGGGGAGCFLSVLLSKFQCNAPTEKTRLFHTGESQLWMNRF